MKKLLTIVTVLLLAQAVFGQNKSLTVNDLSLLVGTWKSHLGKEYEDHPVIKRLNPDRKPNMMEFKWGVDQKIMHLSIFNLDRPNIGDTTLFIEGMLVPNPADTSVRMYEFNAQSDIFFDGTYSLDKDGNIIRHYEVGFTNGTTMKFREKWIWVDDRKQAFDWYTETYKDGKYEAGDIVVRLMRLR